MTWQPNPHLVKMAEHFEFNKVAPRAIIVSGEPGSRKTRHINEILVPAIRRCGQNVAVLCEPISPNFTELIEDAPEDWVFIIKATKPQAIPAMVRSRCQHIEVVGKRRWVW